MKSKSQVYTEMVLEKEIYSKLPKDIQKDILKFQQNIHIDFLLTYSIEIDKLIKYYEDLQSKDFLVTKDELVIDLVDMYLEFFKPNKTEEKENVVKQYFIMWKRLETLYLFYKPIRNEFKNIYFRISDYKTHRVNRRGIIQGKVKRKKYVSRTKKTNTRG